MMGYSPGEFRTIPEAGLRQHHWELGNGTIKLWDEGEQNLILVLGLHEATAACDQLQLLIDMLRGA